MFLVMQAEYDYDGSSFQPLLITPNRAKAEAKVAAMNELKVQILEANKELREHMETWRINNPRPPIVPPKLKPNPVFPGKKKDWTKEQNETFVKILDENRDTAMASAKPLNDWTMAFHNEKLRFVSTFPQDVQDNLVYINEQTQFDIEEVPYEE